MLRKLTTVLLAFVLTTGFVLATTVTGGEFYTMNAQSDVVSGFTCVTSIQINNTSATGTTTLQSDGVTFWSQTMQAGDFAVIPFDIPRRLGSLTLSAAPSGTLVTVWHLWNVALSDESELRSCGDNTN